MTLQELLDQIPTQPISNLADAYKRALVYQRNLRVGSSEWREYETFKTAVLKQLNKLKKDTKCSNPTESSSMDNPSN